MKPPEGERLDDALDMWHSDSWDCPGGKPKVSAEQLAHGLVVLERWFREEFAPKPKLPVVPKQRRKSKARKPAGTVTSSRVPKKIRDAVLARDGYCCQRCGAGLRIAEGDYSLQHRDNRGMGGSKLKHTMANLVALCGSATTGCHGHVESEPLESDRLGWSVPNGATPEEWPVLRFGRSWEQPGEKQWEKTVPHERQIELIREVA